MEIFVYGAGHWRTPVAIREKLALVDFSGPKVYGYLAAETLNEVLILSTCNRLEIVGVAPSALVAKDILKKDLSSQTGLTSSELDQYCHFYENTAATRYLFRVAAGLESQILGEPQILGQVKESFREALKNRLVGPVVGKLFHKSFRTAKRARSETDLAQGSVSIAAAAVETAQELMGGIAQKRVLVLGAGEMASLLVAHLADRHLKDLVVINRTLARAEALARKWPARARSWPELAQAIEECDLVFGALGGSSPVLTQEFLTPLVKGSLWLLDLGVPRNFDPNTATCPGVILRDIDQIGDLVKANQLSRQKEALKVEAIIEEELEKFYQWLAGLSASPTIKDLTRLADQARAIELDKTLSRHDFSPEQERAVVAMSRALTRRILHNPLSFAKACHRHGREDYNLDMVRRIFGLDP
ncbi:MAG: glutamyl-tRNA reductase [Deltaproteobacteria bacterium]|jgi:glutamyl-tRNA reductase|nr:glutamyl-tRNA reductase [Deltaproteobacteria bacterium]